MRILVVGGGAREHAIIAKLNESASVQKLFCAPGNVGIANIAELVNIGVENITALADWAQKNAVDLTVVGPEVPLSLGIADEFIRRGLKIFGPNQKGAQLESSKAFSKNFMKKYRIPTARYETFSDYETASAQINQFGFPVVIKADGLAAGKGVIIAEDLDSAQAALKEILTDKVFGVAGNLVVVEEFLVGREVSLLAFCDGKSVRLMDSARDYKRAFDNDCGLNTGGMGAISPVPDFTAEIRKVVETEIVARTLGGLIAEDIDYRGVLYFGLMLTKAGPKVLEYNCRFGDPETEVLLPRLDGDLAKIMLAAAEGNLEEVVIGWKNMIAVCVVLASGGYPGSFEKGLAINGLDNVANDVQIFHASTREIDGRITNNGGRVLVVSAVGATNTAVRGKIYREISKISWPGMFYRSDIGA
ncbi:MAG: phosphoribosylamine--glycine ligase [Negativicutes bacterium]|jgi:phosphoribosylamine--glycine ligase